MAEFGLSHSIRDRESFEKATGGSNPSPSASREVWHTTQNELNLRKVLNYNVVIVDGVIVKNRYGPTGANVGSAIFVWDDEKIAG